MAAKDVKKAPLRAKRPKIEVQREFEELQDEVASERQSSDAKSIDAERARDSQVREAVAGVDVEGVVRRIAGLGLDVTRSLSEIAQTLTSEVRLLATLRDAVALERRELGQLHKIDVAATALDQLVQDHAQQREQLETDSSAQRQEWDAETARTERERKEQDDAVRKQRQREVEEYEYKKALERKKAQDKYDEETRSTERKNAERQETQEKDWLRRETALKAQEHEVAALQKDAAELPARLHKEVQAATLEGRRQAETKFEQQIIGLTKDAEAEARLSDLRVKTLEGSIAASAAQIAALERQLTEAKQQVQDIAVRAIDGASGSRALSHINQIAMEQAKNRPQS